MAIIFIFHVFYSFLQTCNFRNYLLDEFDSVLWPDTVNGQFLKLMLEKNLEISLVLLENFLEKLSRISLLIYLKTTGSPIFPQP